MVTITNDTEALLGAVTMVMNGIVVSLAWEVLSQHASPPPSSATFGTYFGATQRPNCLFQFQVIQLHLVTREVVLIW